ncbi:MAG: xanthine dehydrogenase family protein subunit M [Acidobacteriota bacterium]
MTAELRPLPAFEYVAPASLAEALALMQQHGTAAQLLAGGTDLLPRMRMRKSAPRIVVDLNRIDGLSFIELRGNNLHIGAGTRLAALHQSRIVAEKAQALAAALRVMASPAIRNRGTIGGNLCNGSKCADTPPPLLVLDASLRLQGADGERMLPLSEFFTRREKPAPGCAKTAIRSDEILTEVIIPCRQGSSTYLKLGRRKGSSIAIASVAALAAITGGKFEEVRIAVSAVASAPVRGRKVEAALRGMPANEETIASASALIKEEIEPISDVRGSAAYRREMASVLVRRALTRIAIGER